MGNLFRQLSRAGIIEDWVDILDMLFSERYMHNLDCWNRGYSSLFSRQIKRLVYVETSSAFENMDEFSGIQLKEKDRIAYNILRHLRNGVAHGRAEIKNDGGELMLILSDFTDSSCKQRSAYMYVSLMTIHSIIDLHDSIAKSARNTKKTDRELTLLRKS